MIVSGRINSHSLYVLGGRKLPIAEIIFISMALLTVAMFAAGLFKDSSIPYTVLLVAIGIGLGELILVWPFLSPLNQFKLTPDLVIYVFLPALIFDSGLSLDARLLMKNIAPILTLAIPALLISTFLIGVSVWLLLDIKFTVALLFGALISSTDPVAVVALFKELGASKRLNILIEGESLLNDATAIVVFSILLDMVTGDSSITLLSTGSAIIEFFRVFCGGALVGLVIGVLVSEMLFRLQSTTSAILTMSVVTAYGGFIIADHVFHVSGVMATIASAVTLNVYGLSKITADVKSTLTDTWGFAGLIANSLLFLLVGLSINSAHLLAHLFIILIVVVFVQLARAVTVYTLVPMAISFFNLPAVSMAERLIIWWGGLKGGLAIAIVLSIPESLPGRSLLISLTLGVVLFTLMVNALTIRPLMKKLKLDRLTDDEKIELEHGLKHGELNSIEMLRGYVNSGIISNRLSKKLQGKIERVFGHIIPSISSEQSRREFYLAALREEFSSLDKLYKSGLVSQYTFLNVRNTLQLERDAFDVGLIQFLSIDDSHQKSIFDKLEMWILKAFREKNWAVVFFSNYQHKRLMQHIQRDIAGIVMARAVLDMFASRDDMDSEAGRGIRRLYENRLEHWNQSLASLRENFKTHFKSIEEELFTRATVKVTQDSADSDLHNGEIGVKAHNLVSRAIKDILITSVNLEEEDLSLKAFMSVSLFKGLSEDVLTLLFEQVHEVTFLPEDIIIGEGDIGDALYIVSSGSAEARKKLDNGEIEVLGQFKAGDFFGELALLDNHVRTATVAAKTAMALLRLTRADIVNFAADHVEVKTRLEQIRDERA
jgi:CPA1 family monovalent cation:H+ antiporter